MCVLDTFAWTVFISFGCWKRDGDRKIDSIRHCSAKVETSQFQIPQSCRWSKSALTFLLILMHIIIVGPVVSDILWLPEGCWVALILSPDLGLALTALRTVVVRCNIYNTMFTDIVTNCSLLTRLKRVMKARDDNLWGALCVVDLLTYLFLYCWQQQLQNGEEVVANHCQYADIYEQCHGWLRSVQMKLAICNEPARDKKIVSDKIDKVLVSIRVPCFSLQHCQLKVRGTDNCWQNEKFQYEISWLIAHNKCNCVVRTYVRT